MVVSNILDRISLVDGPKRVVTIRRWVALSPEITRTCACQMVENVFLILSTNVNNKSLETEVLVAICRPSGDKCQSKTLFLVIFDPRSSIVKSVFDCRLSEVMMPFHDAMTPETECTWQDF